VVRTVGLLLDILVFLLISAIVAWALLWAAQCVHVEPLPTVIYVLPAFGLLGLSALIPCFIGFVRGRLWGYAFASLYGLVGVVLYGMATRESWPAMNEETILHAAAFCASVMISLYCILRPLWHSPKFGGRGGPNAA
jgi:hypothetical protein